MYTISADVFAQRRRRLMDEIGDEAVAIIAGPSMKGRSNDTEYAYRPSSDLLYLTGFREPEAVLVLAPGHDAGEVVLFVPDRDKLKELWEGRRVGPEGAVQEYGADVGLGLSELDEKLPDWLEGRKQLYYTLGSRDDFDRRVIEWTQGLRHRRGKKSTAPGTIVDLRDLLHRSRLVKGEEELGLLRKACEISSEAHILAMKYCRPGMHEYELQALLEYHYRRSGGEYPAYTTIVGSGDNATILHYTENRDRIESGDVVLIDSGCEFGFYAGDITRSFPANGSFTPAQRDIYQAVLEAQKAAIEFCQPGASYDELKSSVERQLTESLVDLGLLEGSIDELMEESKFRDYYPHSIGHSLGIDVHDVGLVRPEDGESRPLEPGVVLTIEPGIYIPAGDESAPEEMRGVGIRIEDDVLVTETGVENLTASCPKTVEEIEALVGSGDASNLDL